MKNTIQSILIAWVLFMYGYLYAKAEYTPYEPPDNFDDSLFYIVEAIVFVLVSLYGIYSNNDKNFKYAWTTLAVFFLIRLIWEIKAAIYGLNVNEIKAVVMLFRVDAVATFIITYLPFLNKLKSKWLR